MFKILRLLVLYFIYYSSERSTEKESTSAENIDDDANEEQDSYILMLTQKIKEGCESGSPDNEADKHETIFEDCSQVKLHFVLFCAIISKFKINRTIHFFKRWQNWI